MKRSDAGTVPHDVLEKLGDRYTDIKYVSRGATSLVFSALDKILDKRIAIKVLTPSRQEDFIRFQKEAKAASQLDHPQLVKILNFDVTKSNHAYLIMDYVEGDDLEHIVNTAGKLSVELALDIALQICEAMEHAHQKQIAHRDLKASNIIIGHFPHEHIHVTVVDFGLARVEVQEPSGRSTPSGSIQGSPRYMSPEQAEGKPSDKRSDMYALGCILFKMITGDTPFDDSELIGILRRHVSEAPPRLRDRTSAQIPDQLELLVAKLLEKDPQKRYQTMREVRSELEAIRFPDASVEQVPAVQQSPKLTRPIVLWAAVVLTVLLIPGLVVLLPYMVQKPDQAVPAGPSFKTSLGKFKEDRVEFDEPGKYKRLVTKSGPNVVVTDEDLRYIDRAMGPKCEGIDLSSFSGVTGEGIKYVRDLKIKCINAKGMNLTPTAWKNLSEIKTLEEIVFEKSNVSDADLKHFENHLHLYIVILGNCPGITDDGVRSVARVRHLSKLDLTNSKVTDDGLKVLRNCPDLYRLYLDRTKIGDQGIQNLKPAPKLFDLHLLDCPKVTVKSIDFIAQTWPKLAYLEMGGATSITTEELESIRPLKNLGHLSIEGIVVTDPILQMLGSKTRLTELYIAKGRFNSESLKYLYPLKELKTLTLLGCDNLSEEDVIALQNHLRKGGHKCDIICPLGNRQQIPKQFEDMYSKEPSVNENNSLLNE